MFYILNLQLFLWIYGTLNKMNEWMNKYYKFPTKYTIENMFIEDL